ncbi:hypothetical protein NDU88_000525 [Pleurodeles waltl]|uniref:Uncharacterized protein n=1 Tax=Pleurodeles waltl TaxID=8319 RepID=A0AAV7L6T1_PLEWA|nr:hypothetical protein NDU88_000525 [Pleurodeles waltl]
MIALLLASRGVSPSQGCLRCSLLHVVYWLLKDDCAAPCFSRCISFPRMIALLLASYGVSASKDACAPPCFTWCISFRRMLALLLASCGVSPSEGCLRCSLLHVVYRLPKDACAAPCFMWCIAFPRMLALLLASRGVSASEG